MFPTACVRALRWFFILRRRRASADVRHGYAARRVRRFTSWKCAMWGPIGTCVDV